MASRILLADDSITIQKVVNRAFADEGIEVVAVSNGDHAERQMAEVNPDLVLADIFMPGKNGYELCEFIKQTPQFRHIPVVLLVGAFEPFDQAEARRVGADDHLTKPFEFRTLVDTVRRLMSQSAQPQADAPAQMPPPEEQPDQSTPRSTNPMSAAAFTPPPFKIDLAAMSDPVEQEGSANDSSDAISFNESAPLDIDDAPYESAGASGATELEMVEERQGEVRYGAASDIWVGRTDELASIPDEENPINSLETGATPAGDNVGAVAPPVEADPIIFSTDLAEARDYNEAQGSEVPSRFGYEAEEFILDFEKTEPPSQPGLSSEIPFDMEAAPLLDSEVSRATFEDESESADGEEEDAFKTRMLEPPPSYRPSWNDGQGGSSARYDYYDHSDYARSSHSSEASHARMDAAEVSAVLTVDDPLGDVLMDEATGRAYEAKPVTELPAAESDFDITGGMFSIEFIPDQEASQTGQAAKTQPVESIETAELTEQPFEAQEPAPAAETSVEPEALSHMPVEESASSEQVSVGAPQEAAGEFDFEMAPESSSAEAAFDAAEHAETGAAEVETILPEQAAHIEDEFTASDMWSEPETQFAAIDIEAVAVEEANTTGEASAPETGFDLSSEIAPVEAEQLATDAPAAVAESATG